MSKTLSHKTDNYIITAEESNGTYIFTNIGATKDIVFSLPGPTNGLEVDITNNLFNTSYLVKVEGNIEKQEPTGEIDSTYGTQVNFKADGTKWVAVQVTLAQEILEYLNLSSGNLSGLYLDSDKKAWAWGNNGYGQLGNYDFTDQSTPVAVCGDKTWRQIVIGNDHALGIDTEYNAWAWGRNNNGALGNNDSCGTGICEYSPVAVCGNISWKQISSGMYFSLGIDYQGKAWTWGGTTSVPTAVALNKTYIQIIAGSTYSMALDYQGKAWTWGQEISGGSGTNNTLEESTPVAVCGDITFCQISIYNHSTGIDITGKAWAWGDNRWGQLGNNDTTNQCTPVAVCGDHTWKQISAGKNHSIGIDINGNAFAWGDNPNGQLGNNDSGRWAAMSTPVPVCGNITFKEIAAEDEFSLGIDTDNNIWAWGIGGRLGNNDISNQSSPVPVCVSW